MFEQSYGGVEGDSASSAELYALLSAIGGIPLRQAVAVTGSVNQHGEVQPIGRVNEKVEGFFDVCRRKGLTGEQGVLIPRANVKHLMLRPDVVEAVREGRFHVWAVSTVDEGMEILSGLAMGERDAEGRFPEGTVNRLVDDRLADLPERSKELLPGNAGGGGEGA
ncbi:MAG TPA: S16 family serine protease [Thermoanaerobaculia bacterium]|nr:S16 family serine protease [Thermoanaerobaculia bacterium]